MLLLHLRAAALTLAVASQAVLGSKHDLSLRGEARGDYDPVVLPGDPSRGEPFSYSSVNCVPDHVSTQKIS